MSDNALRGWVLNQLKELYDSELQLETALPRLAEVSTGPHIRSTLLRHLLLTRIHIQRLWEILHSLGEEPNGIQSPAMEAILGQVSGAINGALDADVRDAALVASLLRAQHCQTAAYRTALIYGALLIDEEGLEMLSETLDEKQAARGELNDLAVNHFFASGFNEKLAAG